METTKLQDEAPTVPRRDAESTNIEHFSDIVVPEAVAQEFDPWLSGEIRAARAVRGAKDGRIDAWRKTLSGKRPKPAYRKSASNLSVPLTVWVRSAMRARIDQGVWDARPVLTVKPLASRQTPDAPSNETVANAIARVLMSEIDNPRGLDGRVAGKRVTAELVDLGMSALKVCVTPDLPRKLAPARPGEEPRKEARRGRVRWEYISRQDLLWCEGYGTNTQEMPFIGHEFDQTWGDMRVWAAAGHYDAAALARVETFYRARGDVPAAKRTHRLAEIYLDFDLDGDGYMESAVVTWHIDAECRLRTIYNYVPSGTRPIFMGNFDLPADLTSADGQGVCEKTEGIQEETDAVHNIAIEAGKRGIHLIAVKENTRAAEELGGDDDEVLPGEVIITNSADEDIQVKQLGDPAAALGLLQLEQNGRLYLMRMFGFDEGAMGNLESGKRVASAVGMTTLREGRVTVRQAIGSVRDMYTEAAYVTLELWKYRPPRAALATLLSPEEFALVNTMVFSASDADVRSQFVVTVNAEDAASVTETRKGELMTLNQFLFSFYREVSNLVMTLSNPNVPPGAREALILLAERMERGVEALLNTVESVPNPEELLVRVGEMRTLLSQIGVAAVGMAGGGVPSPLESTDLGGGVA